jgi:hypothetical protein
MIYDCSLLTLRVTEEIHRETCHTDCQTLFVNKHYSEILKILTQLSIKKIQKVSLLKFEPGTSQMQVRSCTPSADFRIITPHFTCTHWSTILRLMADTQLQLHSYLLHNDVRHDSCKRSMPPPYVYHNGGSKLAAFNSLQVSTLWYFLRLLLCKQKRPNINGTTKMHAHSCRDLLATSGFWKLGWKPVVSSDDATKSRAISL